MFVIEKHSYSLATCDKILSNEVRAILKSFQCLIYSECPEVYFGFTKTSRIAKKTAKTISFCIRRILTIVERRFRAMCSDMVARNITAKVPISLKYLITLLHIHTSAKNMNNFEYNWSSVRVCKMEFSMHPRDLLCRHWHIVDAFLFRR